MIEEKIISEAKQAIFDVDKEKAVKIVRESIARKEDPLELMGKSFIPAINEIGELFSTGRIFLPELIQAAEVMKVVTGVITDSLPKGKQQEKKETVLMGTVQGDIHDIGKTLVVTLMGVNGYTVHDLGRDVSVETFIEKAVGFNVDVIGTSSLLTTTMPEQKKLEKALQDAGLRSKIKTMVGGAPVTERWANRIGADTYAENAHDAVVKLKEL
ncbi:Methionine synthase [subsurface metagenome]